MQNAFSNLSPRDGFLVTKANYLSDFDRQILTYLYQPLMGVTAFSLFLTLWTEIVPNPLLSDQKPHTTLLALLNIDLPDFYDSRLRLEALGLLKTYTRTVPEGRYFVYELYAPQAPNAFFKDDLLSLLLYEAVGEERFNILKDKFRLRVVSKKDLTEITKNFLEVFHVNSALLDNPPATIAETKSEFQVKPANRPSVTSEAGQSFDWSFFKQQLKSSFVDDKQIDENHQLILTMHQLYGISELEMAQYIGESVNVATNQLDVKAFRQLIARQFRGQSNLTTEKTAVAPKNLSSQELKKAGFSASDQKLIAVSRQYSPVEFLQQLKQQQGGYVASSEERVLERLVKRQVFPNSVINILIHYMINVRKMPTLNQSYLDSVANGWLQHHVTTPEAAMSEVKEFYKPKKVSKKRTRGTTRQETLPEWAQEGFKAPKEAVSNEQELALQKSLKALKTLRKGGE
ncbi:helicase DnaB [Loigolactobacillus backii]|uniref:replication initiation and membrane attachment family protein n=1 Tax=Loigolactobacillus backii TaxID=375175 RepID=UPI000C1C8553|nr:DnaD domain protein [Loigolactobacillus backii]PIO83212.1 helicase DnaB [Loigolactobacillus backii]